MEREREREEFWVFRNKLNVYLVKYENLRVVILVDRAPHVLRVL